MKILRPLSVIGVLILLIGVALLWWNRSTQVDMTNYAPADSLVYVEINSIPNITGTIFGGDTWKKVSAATGTNPPSQSRWSMIAAQSGIGPVKAVVPSRAQIAFVVVGLESSAKDDLVRVRPEVAVIIETHTAKWRIEQEAKDDIKRLAQFAYGATACTEKTADADYVECVAPQDSRKIVGAIDGSVVIMGNSDQAVSSCLAVRRGQKPSIHSDPELLRLRKELDSEAGLAFGYVSQTNAAKLFSWGIPLLIGRAPGDQQLEHLLSNSAAKILGSVAWVSSATSEGIEDRYQISLDPEVIRRLGPIFETNELAQDYWKFVPNAFRSVTIYRSKNLETAWSSLNAALALKLDAVSSVLFASLLKSGLSGFGIEDPKELLANLTAPVVTLRPVLGDGSLLLARIRDEQALRRVLANDLLKDGRGQILNGVQADPVREKEVTAILDNGFLIVGKTENMIAYLAQLRNNETLSGEHLKAMNAPDLQSRPAVVTYTNERDSLASSIQALSIMYGRELSTTEVNAITEHLGLKISQTDSSMTAAGIERKTRSAFGQFGSLLSFAQSDSSKSTANDAK